MLRVGATIQSPQVRLNRAVRRLLPMRWRRVGKRGPISMILLLRTAYAFPEEEIQISLRQHSTMYLIASDETPRKRRERREHRERNRAVANRAANRRPKGVRSRQS